MSFTFSYFFFFNATPTPEIYTLSLHDALPIARHSARFETAELAAHLTFERLEGDSCGTPRSPARAILDGRGCGLRCRSVCRSRNRQHDFFPARRRNQLAECPTDQRSTGPARRSIARLFEFGFCHRAVD